MAQLIADRRDIDFVLYEQMNAEELTKDERYEGLTRKTFDLIISEARKLALKELLPTCAEGDKEGVRFENGQVTVPECFHRAYECLREAELTSMTEDPAWGGQGLPSLISQAVSEYVVGANFSLSTYIHLGHGTGKMIELFGTDQLKKLFLKELYTAQWGGTMLLTEAEAGSDVGALTTTAVKNPDGTYTISGNKIFITSGEHNLQENIIHPVLARVEGAPAGTKGISIFIVPKIWVNDDGSLGDLNDVTCTGIEEKMGIHGSATCTMSLGTRGTCRGFLLGEENKGMKIMFHMMNEARLSVGFQSSCTASAAYLYALDYAKERIQGKDLAAMGSPDAPSLPIIQHPDVRRMLMWMKAHVEGMRSMNYYVANCSETAENGKTEEERAFAKGMVELLTPVVKAFCAQRGFDVCIQAIQVYGGYGYIQEYPVEQLARDVKIASLYEGTDGIQAMDLLGRKLAMKKGQVFMEFMGEVQKLAAKAKQIDGLADLAEPVEAAVNRLGEVAMHLGTTAMSEKYKTAFAHAFPFLEAMGDVVLAWMHLWRATVAATALKNGAKKKDKAFYDGQVKTAQFFIQTVLPATLGKLNSVAATSSAAVDMEEASFGS
ncbi:MAG: acyl-CoA dehydrogenase [Deltaproteobacteria bacterium]|nr:acyl-CoA dehydrogenase [Deltaproteobacteria bacterium]